MSTKETNEKEKDMLKDLGEFMVQALTGTIMAQIINNNNDYPTHDKLKENLRTYLNICWHSFGRNNDKYVTEIISKILSFDVIKGSVCLFHWMKTIGEVMINMIDLDSLVHELEKMAILDEKREVISLNMTALYDHVCSDLKNLRCTGDDCDNSYDSLDLF